MIQKNSEVYKIIQSMPNPVAAERDYIECKILETMFADESLGTQLVFTGGATLSKSYNLCPRISHDLDLASIEFTDLPDDRSKRRLMNFKNNFKTFVFDVLRPRINYAINQDKRFMLATDREWRELHNPEQQMSYPTLHVLYSSVVTGGLEHICIEVIPRTYHADAVSYRTVTPYSLRQPMGCIPTVAYQQTFWDKVFALHSFSQSGLPRNRFFLTRHYYDVARIAPRVQLAETYHLFHDTVAYQTKYTTKNIAPIASSADIHIIPDAQTASKLGDEFSEMRGNFLEMPPVWADITRNLQALQAKLNTLKMMR